jgi:hypothetical protein
VQPSRLERAAQKIRDLLAERRGTRSALIAYAGSAHLVMPLTRDADLIARFAAELSPDVMPRVPRRRCRRAVPPRPRSIARRSTRGRVR